MDADKGTASSGGKKRGKKEKSKTAKIAGLSATILWIAGFILTCVLPPGSRFVFLGDLLLLLGFWPLLWIWRPGWPWLVFGVLNTLIGCLLEIAYFIPDANFTHDMIVVRNHLRDSHSALTWMFVGIISALIGIVRMTIHLIQWLARKRSMSLATKSDAAPDSASGSS